MKHTTNVRDEHFSSLMCHLFYQQRACLLWLLQYFTVPFGEPITRCDFASFSESHSSVAAAPLSSNTRPRLQSPSLFTRRHISTAPTLPTIYHHHFSPIVCPVFPVLLLKVSWPEPRYSPVASPLDSIPLVFYRYLAPISLWPRFS